MEPCLCGALDCPSCGPLQGSVRCEEHNRLACADCWERTCEVCGELDCEIDHEEEEPIEVVVSTEETFGDHTLLPAAFDWDEYASRLQQNLGNGYRVRLECGPAPLNAGTDDEIYSRMCDVLDSYVLELDAD